MCAKSHSPLDSTGSSAYDDVNCNLREGKMASHRSDGLQAGPHRSKSQR